MKLLLDYETIERALRAYADAGAEADVDETMTRLRLAGENAAATKAVHADILMQSLTVMTRTLNELVGSCLDGGGKPSAGDLAKARAMLPPQFSNSFQQMKGKS